jgi:hypothetical protein
MAMGRWQVLASEIKASLISDLWTTEAAEAPTGERRRDLEERVDDGNNPMDAARTRTDDVADDAKPTVAAPRGDEEADDAAPPHAERSSAGGAEVVQGHVEHVQADMGSLQQRARAASPRAVLEEETGAPRLTQRRPRRM